MEVGVRMAVAVSPWRRFVETLSAVRTGIFLLIITAIVSAAGTLILQRPMTSSEDMERAYSPQVLRVLDALKLTDVFHAWWFALLLSLVALSIIFVSIERFPKAWKYYSRPYRRTEPHFRAALPTKKQIPIRDAEAALSATERAMKKVGLRPERIVEHDEVSLYAEKSRFSVMAVYVVHMSLLLIFLGGIVDAVYGYKGYVSLIPGDPATRQIEAREGGGTRTLPFALRCDNAGREDYTGEFQGMPKKWWSDLTVVEDGKDVLHKQITVNEPLVYKGIRFYQSGFGPSNRVQNIVMAVGRKSDRQVNSVNVGMSAPTQLADGSTLTVLKFIPDAYRQENGEVFQRSKNLQNPGAQFELKTSDGKTQQFWAIWGDVADPGPNFPFAFQMADLKMANETGLQVSHEPGQWLVWAGCLIMGAGLVVSFYMLHVRIWAVPVVNKEGQLVLWVGGAANKSRESFEHRFQKLTETIEQELGTVIVAPQSELVPAGK
jgi:cytochrome c biogenesis protein